MKKVIALSLSLVMLLGVMTACSDTKTEETTAAETTAAETTTTAAETEATEATLGEPFFTFTDAYGNEAVIQEEPQTIVCVSPTLTEVVFALGAGDKIIAVTDYDDYPADVLDLPKVGDIYAPDVEAIVALEPDLVLASSIFTEDSYNQLMDLGINVAIVRDEESFDGLYDVIGTVASIVGATETGDALVAELKADVDNIVAEDDTEYTVYYCMSCGEYGEYTAGGDTFINDIIEMAGAKNAAADAEGWMYSLEALIAADPDYVICTQWSYDEFTTNANYADLKAVKNGNVILVDSNLFERQGPRNVEALKIVSDLVHAEAAEEAQAA
ncbi:MAG: ABC transporter substrate-binding protein [Clostridia bacterium]|nr:ABC transporter substrate-binding protein [Clostridia bacterium]